VAVCRAPDEPGRLQIISSWSTHAAVYNPHGLNIEALLAHRNETGSIADFPKPRISIRTKASTRIGDVLIPAATDNVDHFAHAHKIRAKILCEGANGPTTAVADEILAEKKNLRHSRYSRQRRRLSPSLTLNGSQDRRALLE